MNGECPCAGCFIQRENKKLRYRLDFMWWVIGISALFFIGVLSIGCAGSQSPVCLRGETRCLNNVVQGCMYGGWYDLEWCADRGRACQRVLDIRRAKTVSACTDEEMGRW